MATTNADRVGSALDLLRQGLQPYVAREMEAAYGPPWTARAAESLHRDETWRDQETQYDVHALLVIMWEYWRDVFGNTLGHAERSLVSELRETRNRWAHQNLITTFEEKIEFDQQIHEDFKHNPMALLESIHRDATAPFDPDIS